MRTASQRAVPGPAVAQTEQIENMFSTGEVLLDCASVEETSLLRGGCELGREMGVDVGEQGRTLPSTPGGI